MKSIFEYTDHLECLRDLYATAKSQKKSTISYTSISWKLGYKSRANWGHVLSGKIPIKNENIKILSDIFNLHEHEAKYLELLIRHNQADNEDRYRYKHMLAKFKKENKKFIDDEKHLFYEEWLNTVIRNLCSCDDFKIDDYTRINDHLRIRLPHDKIKASIQYLLAYNYIKVNEDGFLRVADRFVVNNTQKSIEVLNNFHIEMMKFAQRAVKEIDRKERQISSLNISVSQAGYAMILEQIRECRSKIQSIIQDETDCDRVYQINFQIFPMTTPPIQ